MKTATLTCAAWSIGLLTLLIALPAKAADLAYAGRLVDAAGAPLGGPVDITLRFYGSAAGGDQLGPTRTFDGVALEGGVFQLTVPLEAQDQAAIFGDGTAVVFVEIEAAGKLYPRQRFTPVPLALRIPVDNDSLVYGSDAKLTVGEIAIGQVQGLSDALAQKLDSTPASSAASGYLSAADWTTFNAKQAAITASTSLTAGSIATTSQDAVVIKPYGTQAGETGELRFEEKTGGNYVGFKAPDTLAADSVWTLPGTVGNAGELLVTDGAGVLSWVKIAGANILDATITDAKLQTIATAGKVSGAAITSGTIGGSAAFAGTGGVTTSGNITLSPAGSAATQLRFQDDDASSYVAFKAPSTVASNLVLTLPAADGAAGQFLRTNGAGTLTWGSPAGSGDMLASANLSDLTNVATARTNLGLGALATLSAVGAAEITNGSVADADISASAAIATSKLSGALTAVAGHGLGALATLSTVSTSEITDSTIVNADISGTAAIATSKLSGALTAVSGHGLGSLANLSAVSATEITDGAIANADISETAAIDASKIANGSISSTEFQYLDGLTSSIQTQLDAKASAASPTFTGTISSALGSAAAPSYSFTGDSNTGVWSSGADTVNVSTAGSERLRVTSTGNVGIGTTTPSSKLDVSGTGAFAGTVNVNMASANTFSNAIEFNKRGTTGDATAAVTSGSELGYLTFNGWDGSAHGRGAHILAVASENFSTTAHGSHLRFATVPNGTTAPSERMRITDVGNVGIGTTAPAGLLDVNGKLTVLSGGNVGIGTSTPVMPLDIVGDLRVQGGADYSYLTINPTNLGRVVINTAGTSGVDDIWIAPNQSNGDTPTPAMVLLSNGNVGIGTTSPGNKLQINARSTNYYQTSMSSNAASIFGTSTNASDLDLGSHGAILGLYNNNAFAVGRGGSLALGGRSYDFGGGEVIMTFGRISGVQRPDHSAYYGHLVFETHNSGGMYERMRIDHSGNVGIGTTAPADILQVRAAANKSLLVSSTANTANAVRLGAVNDANSAYVPLEIDASMTNFLGGNVGIGTTLPGYLLHVNGSVAGVGAYNQLSDERFKKDITDIQNSLEKVLAIHGVTYKWIDEERYGSETQIGVIAQEIEKVVPEVVTTGSDGVKRVRYSDLVPLLIEAFKHEHTISQQLKAESEQLKAESEQLKAAFCLKFPEMPFCSR